MMDRRVSQPSFPPGVFLSGFWYVPPASSYLAAMVCLCRSVFCAFTLLHNGDLPDFIDLAMSAFQTIPRPGPHQISAMRTSFSGLGSL